LVEFAKAVKSLEKQLAIARELGERVEEGRGYGNLGNAYADLDEYVKALEFLLRTSPLHVSWATA
jgi:tetratricopeptide (TPR) repeat protein